MRLFLGLSFFLVASSAACGGGGSSTTLPEKVDLAVGLHDFNGPANDAVVVAARLIPDSGQTLSVSVAILDEGGETLADLDPDAPAFFDEGCPPVSRSEGWRIFAATGEGATQRLLDRANRVRIQVADGGEQKEFTLNLPDMQCTVIE